MTGDKAPTERFEDLDRGRSYRGWLGPSVKLARLGSIVLCAALTL